MVRQEFMHPDPLPESGRTEFEKNINLAIFECAAFVEEGCVDPENPVPLEIGLTEIGIDLRVVDMNKEDQQKIAHILSADLGINFAHEPDKEYRFDFSEEEKQRLIERGDSRFQVGAQVLVFNSETNPHLSVHKYQYDDGSIDYSIGVFVQKN